MNKIYLKSVRIHVLDGFRTEPSDSVPEQFAESTAPSASSEHQRSVQVSMFDISLNLDDGHLMGMLQARNLTDRDLTNLYLEIEIICGNMEVGCLVEDAKIVDFRQDRQWPINSYLRGFNKSQPYFDDLHVVVYADGDPIEVDVL